MKKYPVLFTFKFFNGEYEHLDYAIYNVDKNLADAFDKNEYSSFKEAFPEMNKKIINHFYMSDVDEDDYFKDGTAVRIIMTDTLAKNEVKVLEKHNIAYYDEVMELKKWITLKL